MGVSLRGKVLVGVSLRGDGSSGREFERECF